MNIAETEIYIERERERETWHLSCGDTHEKKKRDEEAEKGKSILHFYSYGKREKENVTMVGDKTENKKRERERLCVLQ